MSPLSLAFLKRKRGFFHFVRLLCLALLVAWVIVLAGLSMQYVNGLTLPVCVTGAPELAGFEPVSLHTPDGFTLSGWYHPPANGSVILLLAGNGGSRDAMLPDAILLARHGYGSLTLDYRNCARGGRSSLGYREADDLRLMAGFALVQPGVGHGGYYQAWPEEYEARIILFFDESLRMQAFIKK
jgi:hypothetical protein